MNDQFLNHLRIRTANLAIGGSTLRNQGAPGVVEAAREALKKLPLEEFALHGKGGYRQALDLPTDSVLRRFPQEARNWGAARKALNIFLRDVLYNHYLSVAYRNWKLEAVLELPLDRDIATRLRSEPGGDVLPRWDAIKRVDQETSENYQAFARRVAKSLDTHPVHLDVLYWGRSQA